MSYLSLVVVVIVCVNIVAVVVTIAVVLVDVAVGSVGAFGAVGAAVVVRAVVVEVTVGFSFLRYSSSLLNLPIYLLRRRRTQRRLSTAAVTQEGAIMFRTSTQQIKCARETPLSLVCGCS